MPLIASAKGGKTFDPIPAATHHGICYGVVDLGTQPGGQFKPSRKCVFIWELPDERIDIEKDGVTKNLPRAISKRFTVSLSDKSNLRPMLESWRGREFTPEELEKFELKKVLGANALLSVIHTKKQDGTVFADVAGVAPLLRTMTRKTAENPLLDYSIDDQPPGPLTFPPNMPEWIQKTIKESEEYKARAGGGAPMSQHTPDDRERHGDGTPEEDNIPF